MMSTFKKEKVDFEMPLELDVIISHNDVAKLVRASITWDAVLAVEHCPTTEAAFAAVPGKKCLIRTTLGNYVLNTPYQVVLDLWTQYNGWKKEVKRKFYLPLQ
jgi:hypothetical protein